MEKEILNDSLLEQVDGGSRIVYQVQPGDTLEAIAKKSGVSMEQLSRWNNIQDPNMLQVGSKLTIKF
ncbi:MAG: LysM peptidoglycan-binding domain-containing protein [Oscillospiraceae bacterium]|jgi:LysM repeat protein|nr:LysM peptidoglycan-binding domain-containing protein [Oscillospiraceae bacterium]